MIAPHGLAVLTALLSMVPAAAAAADLEVGVGVGASLRSNSTGVGVTPAIGLSANLGLRLCAELDLPLRLEAMFLTDTFSGGDGVAAVELKSWQGELGALAGIDLGLLDLAGGHLGVEALLGPALRITTVTIRVREEKDISTVTNIAGMGVCGIVYGGGAWRFSLRGVASAPESRLVYMLAGAGVQL